jgi:hypothetical protein
MASRRRDVALTPSRRRGLSDTPRSLDTNELAQNLSKNHPRPSFLETTPVAGMTTAWGSKAP